MTSSRLSFKDKMKKLKLIIRSRKALIQRRRKTITAARNDIKQYEAEIQKATMEFNLIRFRCDAD